MGRYFGTDGFRGEYGRELTDAHAELIGRFLGEFYENRFEENESADCQKAEKIHSEIETNRAKTGTFSKEKGKIRLDFSEGKSKVRLDFSEGKSEVKGARILIGRDTRASSENLEAALIRGIRAAGGEAFSLGICTTPAVAFLVRKFYDDAADFSASFGRINTDFTAHFKNGEEKFSADGVDFSADAANFSTDAAVMITASHNPWRDNGIKIFDRRGLKIDDKIIEKIEDFIDENLKNTGDFTDKNLKNTGDFSRKNISQELNICNKSDEMIDAYIQHLCSFGRDFSGLRIGLDCANGAAFATAPRVFRRLGAEVFTIGTEPDGENINRGIGSTNISALMNFVVENGLDLGFAFDGDGDRCITVINKKKFRAKNDIISAKYCQEKRVFKLKSEEKNESSKAKSKAEEDDIQVLDGDCEMLNLALDLLSRGELKGGKIALTVMSNLGLLRELEAHGIGAEICPVGDRFVAEKMRELGLRLGGEQSGHIIIGDEVTGDGILTAICLARIFSERGFLWKFLPTPQVSENVSVREKGRIMRDERLSFLLRELENSLHGEGRILLRPSGTENLIRIMVEHQNTEKCKLIVSKIGNLVRKIDEEEIL